MIPIAMPYPQQQQLSGQQLTQQQLLEGQKQQLIDGCHTTAVLPVTGSQVKLVKRNPL